MNTPRQQVRNRIKLYMWIVIAGLAISGITAFPLETELQWLNRHSSVFPVAMQNWLNTIYQAIHDTNVRYPYLSYGTDWLAFAHIMLAILFVGPLIDPVKNVWVIQFGMIACVLIFPLAFIAGPVRQIPLFWRFIDSSFGLFAFIPLWLSYRKIRLIESGIK